jgi:hypothetical protein
MLSLSLLRDRQEGATSCVGRALSPSLRFRACRVFPSRGDHGGRNKPGRRGGGRGAAAQSEGAAALRAALDRVAIWAIDAKGVLAAASSAVPSPRSSARPT